MVEFKMKGINLDEHGLLYGLNGINYDTIKAYMESIDYEVTDSETMYQKLQRNNIHPNTKVYGNIIDCLNFIDFLLKKMNEPILEERFDGFNDWGFDDEFVGNHTPWEDSGTETDEYFEERI
jgi:hypothetical protein